MSEEILIVDGGTFTSSKQSEEQSAKAQAELERDRRRFTEIHESMDAFQLSTHPAGYHDEGSDDSSTVLSDMAGFPRNEPDMNPSLYREQGINGDTPAISLQGAVDADVIKNSELWKQIHDEALEYVKSAEEKARDLKVDNRLGWLDRSEGAKAILGIFARLFSEASERLASRTSEEKLRSSTSTIRPVPRRELGQPNPTPDMLMEFLEPTLAPTTVADRQKIAEHTARAVQVLEAGKKLHTQIDGQNNAS